MSWDSWTRRCWMSWRKRFKRSARSSIRGGSHELALPASSCLLVTGLLFSGESDTRAVGEWVGSTDGSMGESGKARDGGRGSACDAFAAVRGCAGGSGGDLLAELFVAGAGRDGRSGADLPDGRNCGSGVLCRRGTARPVGNAALERVCAAMRNYRVRIAHWLGECLCDGGGWWIAGAGRNCSSSDGGLTGSATGAFDRTTRGGSAARACA